MKTPGRVGTVIGLLLFVTRAVIGLTVIGLDKWLGEADMLLLFDLPTVAIYFVAAKLGFPYDIVNAYDLRFFLTGVAVWSVLGYITAWAITCIVLRTQSRSAHEQELSSRVR